MTSSQPARRDCCVVWTGGGRVHGVTLARRAQQCKRGAELCVSIGPQAAIDSVSGLDLNLSNAAAHLRKPGRLSLLVLAVVAGVLAFAPQRSAQAADPNIALGAQATASSVENAGTPANARRRRPDHPLGLGVQRPAVAAGRPRRPGRHQRLRAALGGRLRVAYTIDVSPDATTWTTVATDDHGDGGDETSPSPPARPVATCG